MARSSHPPPPERPGARARRPRPSYPAPPPLQVDTARVVVGGAVLWAAALVVLLLLGDRVDRTWVWTCVAGIVLAGLGLALMRWQGQIRPRGRGDQSERTSNSEVS